MSTITVPTPHVPYGPKHKTQAQADADYLRSAAGNIEFSRCMGSNLTATVVKLLHDAAAEIERTAPAQQASPSGEETGR